MRPAAFADLVGRVGVEALTGSKLLYQLPAELGVARCGCACGLQLSQHVAGSADHEIVESYVLAPTPQRVERLTDGRCLGDRMVWVTSWHHPSVTLGAAPVICRDGCLLYARRTSQ
jgi:hypothetical protein